MSELGTAQPWLVFALLCSTYSPICPKSGKIAYYLLSIGLLGIEKMDRKYVCNNVTKIQGYAIMKYAQKGEGDMLSGQGRKE